MGKVQSEPPQLDVTVEETGGLVLRLGGAWTMGQPVPDPEEWKNQLEREPRMKSLAFDTSLLEKWDSILLTFLSRIKTYCEQNEIAFQDDGLPPGVRRLLALAAAVPERTGARRDVSRDSFLGRVGSRFLDHVESTRMVLGFVGEIFLAFLRLLRGRAQFRRSDLLQTIQRTGADALPIVSLISLLVGLILAFVGAVQLMLFGAQVYVASLVAIGMMRVMGAIMTGIIMAGRTGAAFAAELGSMQVNEEIDALQTLGISPIEFLVLPRVLGLSLMMPLLGVYADFMGMLGGLIVGVFMLDINFMQYYNQTVYSVALTHFWVGLVHSAAFGVLVSLAGCLKGIQCGRSAMAVGQVTTAAVVSGIISIIVATAIITVICNFLGI